MTEVSAESGYVPVQRQEQSRVQNLGSGARALESSASGLKDMRTAVTEAARSGDVAKAARLTKSLHQAEQNLGR